MRLNDIHLNYDTDKGTAHSYIDIYDSLFERHQHSAFNFLEIGALTCQSLRMFNDYFSQAEIYGVDNWAQQVDHTGVPLINKGIDLVQIVSEVSRNYPRIHLHTCDSTNREQVNAQFANMKFKIIVDDGDHHPHAQMRTFENFVNRFDPDGVYVIEDVMDINYLKALVDGYLRDQRILLKSTPFAFLKNGRADDSLLVVHSPNWNLQ